MNNVAYYSMTGNVRRFIEKLDDVQTTEITDDIQRMDAPFILITPSYGFGDVPMLVDIFADTNKDLLKGVITSGNKNWGSSYGGAGTEISNKYRVPHLMTFELDGTDEDVLETQRHIKECLTN